MGYILDLAGEVHLVAEKQESSPPEAMWQIVLVTHIAPEYTATAFAEVTDIDATYGHS